MNAANAITIGGLAGKAQFFGGNTAETISSTTNSSGGWGEDQANSVVSTNSWSNSGGESPNSSFAGIFAFHRISTSGGSVNVTSHRTILSGY